MLPIEVVYVKETLGGGDSGYGLLLASWGVGMVLGSVVFAALRRAALPLLLLFSTLAIGAGYLGLAVAPTWRSPAPARRWAGPATACSGWPWSAPCRS